MMYKIQNMLTKVSVPRIKVFLNRNKQKSLSFYFSSFIYYSFLLSNNLLDLLEYILYHSLLQKEINIHPFKSIE